MVAGVGERRRIWYRSCTRQCIEQSRRMDKSRWIRRKERSFGTRPITRRSQPRQRPRISCFDCVWLCIGEWTTSSLTLFDFRSSASDFSSSLARVQQGCETQKTYLITTLGVVTFSERRRREGRNGQFSGREERSFERIHQIVSH